MASRQGRVAQVVPDLPTFAVDDGFSYEVPPDLTGVDVGSLVRVPLGGRRLRGYVVSLRTGDTSALKPVGNVSGDVPVFDADLLQTLRWSALYYVSPLAVLLGRAAPPNLPRGSTVHDYGTVPAITSRLPVVSREAAAGRHLRPTYLVGGRDYGTVIAGAINGPVAAGRNVAVVAPTVEEAAALAVTLTADYGDRVISVSSALSAREATRAWMSASKSHGVVVVGTPEIALWPLGSPALWVIVEEGRRAMKAKQTPTLQVREVLRRRSLVERSALVMLGPVPTLSALAIGAEAVVQPGRVWPLIEVVDRSEEPLGGRSLAARTVQAVDATRRRGGQVFVFVSRRGYAAAFRCVRCRELRRCSECGSGPDRGNTCRRCGATLGPCRQCGGSRFEPLGAGLGRVSEELGRQIGDAHVGPVESGRQVIVGSERDLPFVPETALTVAVDADSLLVAPHYRGEEDAARLLARVALTVARGRGRRCIIQTAQPQHRAVMMLRSGHPLEYLAELGRERERDQLPPAGELLAIEITGDPTGAAADIETLAGKAVHIHGPEESGGRTRWFLQGSALHDVRVRLRPMVQRWRDGDAKVRVDADPIDL